MIDFPAEYPLSEPLIFDTHAHYDDGRFDNDRRALLTELPRRGVCGVISCGCDTESSKKALNLAEHFDYIYAAVGLHPENIGDGRLCEIEQLAQSNKCVAIGEIGLDYYWTQDNKAEQKALFAAQLALANRLDLPVIVHDRDAHADTLELLHAYRPKGVVHSFSGSAEMAREILALGMYLGIGGVLTFKNAKKLPEIAAALPDDRILLETDAPYLTPAPYRSKTNHSAMIYLTAEKLAALRGTTVDKILRQTEKNAKELFRIPYKLPCFNK